MQRFRTRPARRAPPAAGKTVGEIFARLARSTKFADPNLAADWRDIAGEELAELCRPGRITGAPGARTLEIFAISGAAAAEIQMAQDTLLTNLQRRLGPTAISRITVKQHAAAADDGSPLSQALASFRSAVSRRSESD